MEGGGEDISGEDDPKEGEEGGEEEGELMVVDLLWFQKEYDEGGERKKKKEKEKKKGKGPREGNLTGRGRTSGGPEERGWICERFSLLGPFQIG